MTFKVGDRVFVKRWKNETKIPGEITYTIERKNGTPQELLVQFDDGSGALYFSELNVELITEPAKVELTDVSDFSIEVSEVLDEVEALLNRKNKAYGNSALEPVRVFSTADPVEQIRVRIDDKLSRLKSSTDDNEDTVLDLMGYLVLLRIATRKNND